LLVRLENHFSQNHTDLILAHGDTTTCFASALSSFYHQIPFFHVEAGLRTYCLNSPFPEEFNRQSIAPLASHHFAPTETDKENLLREGISSQAITVTGSTVHEAVETIKSKAQLSILQGLSNSKDLVVVTLHRRENAGQLDSVLQGIREAAFQRKETLFVCPVHPNPNVHRAFKSLMTGLENILLVPPLEYPQFISLMLRSQLIVTDSGGVQEEAAFLKKPVLLARQETERNDGLRSGLVQLMGLETKTVSSKILEELSYKERPVECGSFSPQATKASELIAQQVLRAVL
jgi:UDP-N-acetylglucosamine 2-epimerase (non-hydrolysing)